MAWRYASWLEEIDRRLEIVSLGCKQLASFSLKSSCSSCRLETYYIKKLEVYRFSIIISFFGCGPICIAARFEMNASFYNIIIIILSLAEKYELTYWWLGTNVYLNNTIFIGTYKHDVTWTLALHISESHGPKYCREIAQCDAPSFFNQPFRPPCRVQVVARPMVDTARLSETLDEEAGCATRYPNKSTITLM